ncbi:MAG: ABC transporter ATP-binding protein [Actinomycetota bacterium]
MDMTAVTKSAVVLEAKELYRFYHAEDDETFALRGVSMSLHRGEMVAVMGPSGSGKSTLLSCLAGLDEPDGGHVVVDGMRITRKPEHVRSLIRAQLIGILRQSGNLIEHLTLMQNLRLASSLTGRKHASTQKFESLLDQLGLQGKGGSRPSRMSGGELARAGLAVALANDPPVLIADEPTGEVDAEAEQRVLHLLRARAQSGSAVLVVSHSARVAAAADRIVTLSDGRIVA